MSFEKSKMTFRVLLTGSHVIGKELEDGLVARAYAAVPNVEEYSVSDVCRGRTLWGKASTGPDDTLPEGFLRYGSNLYFALRTREKKLDKKLINEYLEYLIEKDVTETGNYPTAKRKKELKKQVQQTLMSLGYEDLAGIRALAPIGGKCILVEGSSAKNVEKVAVLVGESVKGLETACFTPDLLFGLNSAQAESYEPFPINGKVAEVGVGADFLTWLWMASETMGVLPSGVAVALCGDITFKGESNEPTSSVTTKLSKGVPWEGFEPLAAFDEGKRVSSAKFRFNQANGRTYEVSIDDTFCFSGFNVIDGADKSLEAQSAMDDRAIAITDFLKLLTGLFYKFKQSGKANVTLISDWVKNRWQSDPEGLYTVADPSDTVIGEADLSETLAEAPTLNDIFKFLISRVPGLEEATNKLARPALIIDKKAKKVSLIDMAADPVTVQSEPAPEPSQV